MSNIINFEQGWNIMQKGIRKLQNILEGFPEPHFTSEEYTLMYTYVLGFSFPHNILEAFSLFAFNWF